MATKKKKKTKRGRGAPTKYKPEYCKQIVEFMSTGKALVQFAAEIGTHKDSIYEWAKKHQEFSDALKKAKAACENHWLEVGRSGMYMGGKDNPFQPSMWIFMMKARFGYSDKQEIEHSVKEPIKLAYNLDDDDK